MGDLARWKRLGLVAAAAGVVFGAATMARADRQNETLAQALFVQAKDLLAAGKVHEACEKFTASQKLDPALGTLLNLAACHETEGKTASSWAEFSEALAQATRGQDDARVQFAKKHMAALEKQLHRVLVEVMSPVAGMEVLLDGQPLAREALGAALPLDPGEHTVEVRAPGRATFTRKLTLGPSPGTDRIEVPALEEAPPAPTVSATATATTPPPPPTSTASHEPARPPKPDDGSTQRTIGFVVGGVGVVSLGAAVIFGIQTASHTSDRDALCASNAPCFSTAAFQADHDARVSQMWMLVTGGVGIAAAAAGTYLVLTAKKATAVQVAPQVGARGAGVVLVGRF